MRENNKKKYFIFACGGYAVWLFGSAGTVCAGSGGAGGNGKSNLFIFVTSGNIACEEGQADTGIKKGLRTDHRNRCDHGNSLVQLLSGNPGVIGSNRNDHILYVSIISDIYGAGCVQGEASGAERGQRSDPVGWRVYYGAGIFCGESGDRGNPMGNAVQLYLCNYDTW